MPLIRRPNDYAVRVAYAIQQLVDTYDSYENKTSIPERTNEPQTKHRRKKKQSNSKYCFGQEASNRITALIVDM